MNKDFIVLKFMEIMAKHRGRENAVPRDKILAHLRPFAPNLDRPFEAKECFEYLCKRIPREQAVMRLKILLTYYPYLTWKNSDQLELF